MDLQFDERRLLVPGVHDVMMEEVKAAFGQFQRSDRRMTLFAKLTEYVDALKKAACGQCVILDGSFVMACIDEPDDIDIILVMPPEWDMDADLKPYHYNLVSKNSVRRSYGFDLKTIRAGSVGEREWIDFFGQVNIKWHEQFGWPADAVKGIIRVML